MNIDITLSNVNCCEILSIVNIRLDELLNKINRSFKRYDRYLLSRNFDNKYRCVYYDWLIKFIENYMIIEDNKILWYVELIKSKCYYYKGCCEENNDMILYINNIF